MDVSEAHSAASCDVHDYGSVIPIAARRAGRFSVSRQSTVLGLVVLAALLLVAFRRKEYDGDQSGGIETVVASLAASGWDVARSCGGHGNTACTAYQTSTAYGGMAEKALVDLNASNWGVDQCTHTQTQTNPWWRVDFGRLVNVNAIRVFGRTDCCYDRLQGFQVRVGSNHMVPQQNPACHHESNEPMQPISEPAPQPPKFYTDVNCSSPMHGRYVYIQIPGGNRILSLCQVQVWGREYNPWIEGGTNEEKWLFGPEPAWHTNGCIPGAPWCTRVGEDVHFIPP